MIDSHHYIEKMVPGGLRHPHHISERKELFFSLSLRVVGMSMVGVFVPALLYKSGYSMSQVALYGLTLTAVRALATLPVARAIARFGPKHVLATSYILGLAFIFSLIQIESSGASWLYAAVFAGLYFATFYLSSSVDMTKLTADKEGGSVYGYFYAILKLSAALGPVLSGLIAAKYGFSMSLYVAFGLVALATLPLFLTPEPMQAPLKLTFQGLFSREYLRDYVAQVSLSHTILIAANMWPFYLAVIVISSGDFKSLGFITSAGLAASVLSAPLIGYFSDRVSNFMTVVRAGSFISGVLNAMRLLAVTPLFAGLIGVAAEIAVLMMQVPFGKGRLSQVNHNKGQRIATLVMYEYSAMTAHLIMWSVFLAASQLLESDRNVFMVSFILAGLMTSLVQVYKPIHRGVDGSV